MNNGSCALCTRKSFGSKSAINAPTTTPLTQANLQAHEDAFDMEMLAPEDSLSMFGGSNNNGNLLKKRFAEQPLNFGTIAAEQ